MKYIICLVETRQIDTERWEVMGERAIQHVFIKALFDRIPEIDETLIDLCPALNTETRYTRTR